MPQRQSQAKRSPGAAAAACEGPGHHLPPGKRAPRAVHAAAEGKDVAAGRIEESFQPQQAAQGLGRLESCCLDDFEVGRVLGTGSFGRVSLARHKASGAAVAIKALSKAHIVKGHQIAHLRSERDVLAALDHPLLVRLHGVCQDPACVYFVLEYVPGGEFFSHLKAAGRLTEDAARIYAGEVVAMLEHLHARDIAYRDLKPENLLLDAQGHLKLADFGFAKALASPKRTYTLCGTPDYLAPEVVLNKGHGKAVDWWALGVLLYEMLAGFPPFLDDDPLGTYKKILKGTLSFPGHFSATARDLIRKLLQVDLSKRYGCLAGGPNDIKSHPFFRPLDFAAAARRALPAPIKPAVAAPDDASNFEDFSHLEPLEHAFTLSSAEQALFAGF